MLIPFLEIRLVCLWRSWSEIKLNFHALEGDGHVCETGLGATSFSTEKLWILPQKSDLIPGVIMTIWLARVRVQLLEGSKLLMKNELSFHVKTFILSTHFPVLP